jgi:anaerobic selenocysteine-containing dehydrogenase
MNEIRLPEMLKERPLGADRYPVFHDAMPPTMGEGQSMALYDALLTGEPYPIKALIVSASNILLTWPNSNKLKNALDKLDFMVVMDQFMTETAKMADIVLPAATFLESDELSVVYWISYGEQYFSLRNKVVEVDECWPDWKFWFELARKMGYGEYFPWRDMAEMIEYLLEPAGISFKGLKEKPNVVSYGVREYKKYEKGDIFMTPSKKVELYSQTLKDLGYDPLPVHLEPLESPSTPQDLSEDYPLILTTGSRLLAFHQSKYRNLPSLARISPEPFAEINPETARNFHVEDDKMMVVKTKWGSIEIKARISPNIMPRVVSISHGWQDANVNLLTDETPADPVTGYPGLKSSLCSIRKK